MNKSRLRKIYGLISEAESKGLLINNEVLSGFSGEKLIGLLQRLSLFQVDDESCYLEIGVFQGLTLLSVAKVLKHHPAYGIDNFAQFDPQGKNLSVVEERRKLLDADNAVLINQDYEDALETLDKHIGSQKVGVFFIDGPHDYRSQLMCLQLAKPYLSDDAIIVIDDSNYQHVRQANRDFLVTNPEFKLIFEAYTSCHPKNMSPEEKERATKGWWNGVNVLIKDGNNEIEPMYPPTFRKRHLFENEHITHAARYGSIVPDAMRLSSSLLSFKPLKTLVSLVRLFVSARKHALEFTGKYEWLNTFSEACPKTRFNPSLIEKSSTID